MNVLGDFFWVFAVVRMESVTATVVRSPFGVSRLSNSAGRSGVLTANGPDFVRFGTKFLPSIKV